MNIEDLLAQVKKQNLPTSEYAVFGSARLALLGLRECQNIDLITSQKLWNDLLVTHRPDSEGFIRIGAIKISNFWFAPTSVPLHTLINEADEIDGIRFVKLSEIRRYKSLVRTEKDMRDVRLIDSYLNTLA